MSEDGREIEPYISAEQWNVALKATGFNGTDTVIFDGNMSNTIIASASRLDPKPKRLTVLSRSSQQSVERLLLDRGYVLDFCDIDQEPTPGQDILSLLDLDGPYLHDITSENFHFLQSFLSKVKESTVLWVTGASQIECKDPNYSLIIGMGRTLRRETTLDLATLELETFDESGFTAVGDLLDNFRDRLVDFDIDPDSEYAFSRGKIQTSRMHWIRVSDELLDTTSSAKTRQLAIHKPGFMQTLHWKPFTPTPIIDDWIEVETRAVGVNFKVSWLAARSVMQN